MDSPPPAERARCRPECPPLAWHGPPDCRHWLCTARPIARIASTRPFRLHRLASLGAGGCPYRRARAQACGIGRTSWTESGSFWARRGAHPAKPAPNPATCVVLRQLGGMGVRRVFPNPRGAAIFEGRLGRNPSPACRAAAQTLPNPRQTRSHFNALLRQKLQVGCTVCLPKPAQTRTQTREI